MSHLHLNIFPISVPDTKIHVGVLPFDSRDALRELRANHGSTHIFKRVRIEEKDMIYSVRLDGAPCDLTEDKRQINLLDNLGVVRGLVVESYIAGFAGKSGRTVVDVRPLKVLSSESHHDFIAQAATGEIIPPWLVVRLAHAIEARVFEFEGQQPFLGLVFDHHSYRRVAKLCSEWLKDGFDLTGLYVSEQVPFNDARIQPRLRLVGRVSKVEGTTLHLTDCREGRETVDAATVEVEADYDGFMRCLTAVFGGKAKAIERKIFDYQSIAQVGPKKLGELLRVENKLTQKPIRLLPGVEATVLPHLDTQGKKFPTVRQAPGALYVFYAEGRIMPRSHYKEPRRSVDA